MNDVRKILSKRIDEVRGDMSYREFSKAIERATGKFISHSSLHQYVIGTKDPSINKIEIIAKYAGKPVSWFYSEHDDNEAKTTNPAFAQRLKKLRQEKGITQQELADALNISRTTIGMYEINQREPDNATLVKLANYFDVSIDYLLGRTDDPTNPVKGIVTREDFERVLGPGDYPEVMAFKEYIDRENLTWEEAMKLLELAKKIRDMSK